MNKHGKDEQNFEAIKSLSGEAADAAAAAASSMQRP